MASPVQFGDISLEAALTKRQKQFIAARTFTGGSKIAVLRRLINLGISIYDLEEDDKDD